MNQRQTGLRLGSQVVQRAVLLESLSSWQNTSAMRQSIEASIVVVSEDLH
jgi:hypothetical protein